MGLEWAKASFLHVECEDLKAKALFRTGKLSFSYHQILIIFSTGFHIY